MCIRDRCVFTLLCSLHFCLLMCFVIKFAIPKLVLCRACLGMLFCNYPENKLNLNAIYKNEAHERVIWVWKCRTRVCIILINILYYTNSIVKTESVSKCKNFLSRKFIHKFIPYCITCLTHNIVVHSVLLHLTDLLNTCTLTQRKYFSFCSLAIYLHNPLKLYYHSRNAYEQT